MRGGVVSDLATYVDVDDLTHYIASVDSKRGRLHGTQDTWLLTTCGVHRYNLDLVHVMLGRLVTCVRCAATFNARRTIHMTIKDIEEALRA